jgi:class 3 adenylate cyclase/alpha-beta hydrolase superfamily lysophospholipase
MRPDVHYARNGDVAIAYQVVGDGPRDLLVVVGYLSNLEYAWHIPEIARFYQRLATFSRLILMDRRGTGLSDRFGSQEAPALETTNDDTLAVLDDAGSARTAVLGIWDGCAAAMAFAATYPQRVSSLVLYSASPGGRIGDLAFGWDDEAWDSFLADLRTGWGTRAWTVRALRWQSPSMLEDPRQLEQWITYTRLSASPASAVAMQRVYREIDLRELLPVIGAPTLVLHRTGDQTEEIEAGRYVASRIPDARFVELPGNDAVPWVGDADQVLDEVEDFITGQRERPGTDRVLATVLFTDIVDSTAKAAELGDAHWKDLLAEHASRARVEIERHRGVFVDSTGDGLLAHFDGPARAVRCAQAIAEAVRSLGIEIRAGAHTGEVELVGDRIQGIAVHTGARVASMAGPSEVWVSSTVRDLTAGSGLTFEDAGEHELKGVPARWHLYLVTG